MAVGSFAHPVCTKQEDTPKTFTLMVLLREMTTSDMVLYSGCGCADPDCYPCAVPAPAFRSALVDEYLFYGAVLDLVRVLRGGAMDDPFVQEPTKAWAQGVVLRRATRRFLLYGEGANELCRQPSCEDCPLKDFDWCDTHLRELDLRGLLAAAQQWGEINFRDTTITPTDACDSATLEPLVHAAVASGWFDAVRDAIIGSAFFDLRDVEDNDAEEVALGYRYLVDRERLLLTNSAERHRLHLSGQAGQCRQCGARVVASSCPLSVRPHFCSEACDRADRTAAGAPHVPREEPPF